MFSLWAHDYKHWFSSLQEQGVDISAESIPLLETGGRSAAIYFRPLAPRGCVLLLHGTGNDALFGWNLWIEELLLEEFAVFALDLEGHGSHSESWLEPATFGHSLSIVRTVLAAKSWQADQLIICGYSLGGLMALRALQQGWLAARCLITLALPQHVALSWNFVCAEGASLMHRIFWQQLQDQGWRPSLPALGPWRRTRFPLRLRSFSQRSYPACVAELFRLYDADLLLAQLQLPVLCIYGANDRLAPPHLAAARPRAASLIVPAANHFLLPWYPESVAGALRWLETTALTEPHLAAPN